MDDPGSAFESTHVPGFSARPARPATWVSSCASFSRAAKVGAEQPFVDIHHHYQRHVRRSWPFASICVPTRMPGSPLCTSSSLSRVACLREVLPRSMRMIGVSGKRCVNVSSRRSVPGPRDQLIAAAIVGSDGASGARTTVMALQPPAMRVHGHRRRVAARALRDSSRSRGTAAPAHSRGGCRNTSTWPSGPASRGWRTSASAPKPPCSGRLRTSSTRTCGGLALPARSRSRRCR